MKKVILFPSIALLTMLIFSNCHKTASVVQPLLNINYKAAFVVNGASNTI